MTGILKVDTIQKNDGSTPTVGDLGLNESNAIIQQVLDTQTINIGLNSTSYTDAGYSITFTPKKSNSKILVELKGGRPWMPITTDQLDIALIVDGDTSDITNKRISSLYSSSSAVHMPMYGHWVYQNTGTNARTYTIQWRTGGGGTQYLNTSPFPQSLVVTEIGG